MQVTFKFHVVVGLNYSFPSTATMKFSLSILSLSLLAGAYASNVLDLDPTNFDSAIGQGKPGLVELCAASPTSHRVDIDVSLVSHLGGMSFILRSAISLLKCRRN